MLSRFHLIPERNGRTDRQTDGQICYINTVRQYADARQKLNHHSTLGICLFISFEFRCQDLGQGCF